MLDIDWNTIAAYAGGITIVAISIIVSIFKGIQVAKAIAANNPATNVHTHTDTRVYTTDSVAFEKMTGEVSALNVTMMELHAVVIEIRDLFTGMIREKELDEEVDRRTQERINQLVEAGELARKNRRNTPTG